MKTKEEKKKKEKVRTLTSGTIQQNDPIKFFEDIVLNDESEKMRIAALKKLIKHMKGKEYIKHFIIPQLLKIKEGGTYYSIEAADMIIKLSASAINIKSDLVM